MDVQHARGERTGIRTNRHGTDAGSQGGSDPGRSIFENEGVRRLDPQEFGCPQIPFRVRFPVGDQVCGDRRRGHREAGRVHADVGQNPVGGRHQGYGVAGEDAQEILGPWQRHNSLGPDALHGTEFGGKRFDVGARRSEPADGVDGLHTVGGAQDLGGVQAVTGRELTPYLFHNRCGIHERAVHVEQDGTAVEGAGNGGGGEDHHPIMARPAVFASIPHQFGTHAICCDGNHRKHHGTPGGTMSTSQRGPYNAYSNPDQQPVTMGQLRWYMEGMRHARLASVFGVLGIFSLGAIFGPLAISQAKKAEALGVPASEGRVLGWVGIGLFILWVVFFIVYLALIFTIIGSLPDSGRFGA